MGTIASQITSLTVVYSTVYSDTDQRKHQSSASLAFVWGIHRRPVNSPHKWPVTRKMSPFDDVIMALLDKWTGIPVERLKRLVASMPRRRVAIMRVRLGNTRHWINQPHAKIQHYWSLLERAPLDQINIRPRRISQNDKFNDNDSWVQLIIKHCKKCARNAISHWHSLQ